MGGREAGLGDGKILSMSLSVFFCLFVCFKINFLMINSSLCHDITEPMMQLLKTY